MTQIKASTRHDEHFDIFTDRVDPSRSPYAGTVKSYVKKVAEFYQQLGISSAIWATPINQPPKYVELGKEYEYFLRLDQSRIVAYVNEKTWSPYLYGERSDFEHSRTPITYEHTSLVISAPLLPHEVTERQIYDRRSPDKFDVIERRPWP